MRVGLQQLVSDSVEPYFLRVVSADLGSLPDLLEGALAAVESILGRQLSYFPSGAVAPRPLKNRKALIKKTMTTKGHFPVFVDEESHVSSLTTHSFLGPGMVWQIMFNIKVAAGLAETDQGPALLVKLGQALRGLWGFLDSEANWRLVLTELPGGKPRHKPAGLPSLATGHRLNRCPPAVPTRLGWINYWSAEAALAAGVGEKTAGSGKRQYPRMEPLDGGAWLVRITDEPLDPGRAQHVRLLAEAYERFARVGRPCD
jgi:hypothetical protein